MKHALLTHMAVMRVHVLIYTALFAIQRGINNQMIRKYAFNTGWLFLEKTTRIIVTLVVWALIIRYLGPEQFGVFSYALSYIFCSGCWQTWGWSDPGQRPGGTSEGPCVDLGISI